jgi:hypothetical protein
MTYGEDFTNTSIWYVDGIAKNFTGWTGTWTITRVGTVMLSGTNTLTSIGEITTTIPAASVNLLVPYLPTRGFILPGTIWAATLTNGTDSIVLNAAVQLIRNKTTISPIGAILPGWVI